MRKRLLLILAAYAAQASDPRLAAITARVAGNLAKIPDYTCTQTIERFKRGESCRNCAYRDRLRLEVAVINGREQFAWPGAGGFEDRDIYDFAGSGAIVTGDFAALARTVFMTDRPEFTFAGATTVEGRAAVRYDFRVAAAGSNLRARTGGEHGVSGYAGSFWADPETLDLIRLDVRASSFPAKLDLRQFDVTIRYARLHIGESDFPLPLSTEAVFLSRGGVLSRNRTEYSGCRHYVGESTIRFSDEEPAAATAPGGQSRSRENPRLPPNLTIETELASALRVRDSAVGDPVAFVLTRDVKWNNSVVPKGALLRGRIVQLVEQLTPGHFVLLGVRASTLEFNGTRIAFQGRIKNWVDRRFVRLAPGDSSVISLGPERMELRKGYRFNWITEETP
jgi:hypothetical protein